MKSLGMNVLGTILTLTLDPALKIIEFFNFFWICLIVVVLKFLNLG